MDDLISRQVAIDAIYKVAEMFPYRIPGQSQTYRQYNEAWSDACDASARAIEDLPSAQPKAIRPKFVADDKYLKNYFQTFPHCPKCNYELETGDCYCRVCGCHIDWSEDDE